ncbi:MAG: Regulator of RpoS [Verrucomicrobiae bacterium]|nr:Regulator of RpoS [Verrucomicrobiae bacterium]
MSELATTAWHHVPTTDPVMIRRFVTFHCDNLPLRPGRVRQRVALRVESLRKPLHSCDSNAGTVVAKRDGMSQITDKEYRILLVDDDDEVRKALTKLLQHEGYSVTAQPDVTSAVRCLAGNEETFDLVISDVVMPDINGMEFLHLLKADIPDLPVILITAFGDLGGYYKSRSKGAAAYLCKPLEIEAFLDTVRRALKHRPVVQGR